MDNTKIDIKTMLDMKNEILELSTYLDGLTNQVSQEIIDFKEECITQALIELGWTPNWFTVCDICFGDKRKNRFIPRFLTKILKNRCLKCNGKGIINLNQLEKRKF